LSIGTNIFDINTVPQDAHYWLVCWKYDLSHDPKMFTADWSVENMTSLTW